MSLTERLTVIRQIVKAEKKVSVSDLSRQFQVTEETIRRDLEKLEKEGLVARTYGGAVLNAVTESDHVDFLRRAQTHVAEKQTIASIAAGLFPERATIGADASSTVMETISLLGGRSDLTVLTNSIKIVRELDQSQLNIMSTGGLINKNSYCFQGEVARAALERFMVDTVLISCKGLNIEEGIFDSDANEAELKKVLISRGGRIILLADHTKFNQVGFIKLLDFNQLDIVVTDQCPSKEWLKVLQKAGIRVMYPGSEEESRT